MSNRPNDKNNEKLEKVLAEAIELYEKGKTIPEILNLYPNYKEELQEMFQVIKALMAARKNIVPPKELLVSIISQIQDKEGVTNLKENRYLDRGIVKGRTSIDLIKHQITNLMTWNWKILLPIGIVAVLVVVVFYTQLGTRAPQVAEESTPSPVVETRKPLPKATGNVDDAVNAVITAVYNELAILNEYDNDIALVEIDSQAISDFGQSYNENEF